MKTMLQDMGKEYRIIAEHMLDRIEGDLLSIGIRHYRRDEKGSGITVLLSKDGTGRDSVFIRVFPLTGQVEMAVKNGRCGKAVRFHLDRNSKKTLTDALRKATLLSDT